MNFIKQIFNDDVEKVKTPETSGLILMLLLILKVLFSNQFELIKNNIVKEIEKLELVIQLLELFTVMFFILSVIVYFFAIIFSLKYIIIGAPEKMDKSQRFFIGSKRATLKVNSWLLILIGYLHLFDKDGLMEYIEIIWNLISKFNKIIYLFIAIYFVIIIFSALYLIDNIAYKFLFYSDDLKKESSK